MLLGLLVLSSANAFAADGDVKASGDLRFAVINEANATVEFIGVSQEAASVKAGDDIDLTIPGTVSLLEDNGSSYKDYNVVSINPSWSEKNDIVGTAKWYTAEVRSQIKAVTVETRLSGNETSAGSRTDRKNWDVINNILFKCTALEKLVVKEAHLVSNVPAISLASLKEIDFSGVSNDGQKVVIAGATGNIETIKLPGDGPVEVVAGAFKDLTKLKSVTFGNGSKSKVTIGANAFENCGTALTGTNVVGFSNWDKVVSIGAAAFKNCNMTTATIGADVATLGAGAFEGTTLKTVEFKSNKLTAVETGLFTNQAAVETLKIESTSVTTIKKGAFGAMTGLKNIDFSKATALTTIDGTEFATLTTLVNVNFEGAPLNNVAGIDPSKSAASLETFKFPANFDKVVPSFKNCVKLAAITIPAGAAGITSFQFCKKLAKIDLSGITNTNFTSIPANAFDMTVTEDGTTRNTKDDKGNLIKPVNGIDRFNTALEEVKLPATITTIGDNAFAGCSKLGEKNNLKDLAALTSIGASAFRWTVIPEVDLSGAVSKNADGSYKFTEISSLAFADNTALTIVKLPEGIKTIKDGAFKFGSVSTNALGKAESYGKGKLATLELNPAAIESIGVFAFMGSAFDELDLSEATNDKFTTIEEGAFAFNTKLETVTLPVQINEIVGQYYAVSGVGAFADDTALASINLHQTNIDELDNIFTTYDGATYTKERSIALPTLTLTKDETKTLANGDALADLEDIDDYALQFTGLTAILIPETVGYMGTGAFRACTNLATFEWRNAIQSYLPSDCFRGDVKLTDVTFLSIETCTTMSDEDIFFMCNKANLTVTVTPDSYKALVANGYGNDNRTYSTLASEGNVQWGFTDNNLASDGYYYATYYNDNNSSWFDATKFDVYAAVVEANKVVLKPATADGGFYKVAKATYDYLGQCDNEKISICVVRSKDKDAVPQLNSNDGNDQVSTLPVTNHLQMSDGTATGSKLNYVFKLGRNKAGVVAFFRITSGTFDEGKIYINAEETSARMDIVVEGEGAITGIKSLFGAEEVQDDAPVYNMQGARVNAAQKGVYIKNGKKFIVK